MFRRFLFQVLGLQTWYLVLPVVGTQSSCVDSEVNSRSFSKVLVLPGVKIALISRVDSDSLSYDCAVVTSMCFY